MIRVAISPLFLLFTLGSTWAQMKLPTVEEALELSSQTGRPIFAMAGQKT